SSSSAPPSGRAGRSRWADDGPVRPRPRGVARRRLLAAPGRASSSGDRPREEWPLEAYPDVPMRYVACADDRILDPDWQVRSARALLGIEADVLDSSHSPMLAQPAALADLLVAPFNPAG
ncbi:MAG: alpha/beta fold hydrolase, partial [Acidimicrobiales bacterium]